jgi:Domain of unknown function (DUF4345)
MNLNFIGAILITGLGIVGLLQPLMVAKLIGLTPSAPHGLSEIRATLGGFFIGLGGFALYAQNTAIYGAIGMGWAGAAIARILSLIIDRQINKENIGGVFLEGGIGMLLLLK